MEDTAASLSSNMMDRLARLERAQRAFAEFPQEKVDAIFQKVALEATLHRLDLAKLAVENTGMGVAEDKMIKNHFASEIVYNKYRDLKTCDVIEEDLDGGITKVAYPVGPILAIIPVTNPTSTVFFKGLLSIKTRNAIVFAPHPRAALCTAAAMNVLLEAAISAGAPADIMQILDAPTVPQVKALMHDPGIKFILATGGGSMVRSCYSSGKPTIGVGAGNTCAVIDETADIPQSVSSILLSKTFDNGMICATEQSIVAVVSILDAVKKELEKRGAYLLSSDELPALTRTMFSTTEEDPHHGNLRTNVVGQSVQVIAKLAGLSVPSDARILVADLTRQPFDLEDVWSKEKLSPVLSLYQAQDVTEAMDMAQALVTKHGIGHTSSFFTDPKNRDRIHAFEMKLPTGRILIDQPAAFGAIGDLYNSRLEPAMTLGCGTLGGSSFSGNVGPMQLLNIKTVVHERENMLWFKLPPAVYFKSHILGEALKDLPHRGIRSVLIVTDGVMEKTGILGRVTGELQKLGLFYEIFDEVTPDPTSDCLARGVAKANESKPDCIIGLGGGSPMDAAKVIRLLYEHPELELSSLVARFMDIRKRVERFPHLGTKVKLVVCIPTTSGTGAEVTPFAVITDSTSGRKYPICSYRMTPDMAIVDASLCGSMPAKLTAHTGFDAFTHAVESYTSVLATDITKPMSLHAAKILFENVSQALAAPEDLVYREKVHHGSLLAGMAFGNAFLGICHSMAHALGSIFHISHGLANAYCIGPVIRFNAVENPTRRAAFAQYHAYRAVEDYAELAVGLGLSSAETSMQVKVQALLAGVESFKQQLGIPRSMQEGEPQISEEALRAAIPQMAELAFDDQCTGANPRFPLIEELEGLFLEVYLGM